MTKFLTFIQNSLVAGFVFCFVFVCVYVPQPLNKIPSAEAQAGDVGIGALVFKEYVLDLIAYALVKVMIVAITTSIVNWINSGFEGSPAFIQDLKATLLSVADEEFDYFLEELDGPLSFLCTPFKLDINIALNLSYENRRNGYPQGGRCDLSGSLANIENFISGDFNDGGWDAWFKIINQPEIYTPYGSYLEAEAQANLRISDAQQRQSTELNWGKGFLSRKECSEPSVGRPVCKIITPGDTIVQSLNFHLSVGTQTLVAADEIDEIILALIAYLAQTVITGAGGLLGFNSEDEGTNGGDGGRGVGVGGGRGESVGGGGGGRGEGEGIGGVGGGR